MRNYQSRGCSTCQAKVPGHHWLCLGRKICFISYSRAHTKAKLWFPPWRHAMTGLSISDLVAIAIPGCEEEGNWSRTGKVPKVPQEAAMGSLEFCNELGSHSYQQWLLQNSNNQARDAGDRLEEIQGLKKFLVSPEFSDFHQLFFLVWMWGFLYSDKLSPKVWGGANIQRHKSQSLMLLAQGLLPEYLYFTHFGCTRSPGPAGEWVWQKRWGQLGFFITNPVNGSCRTENIFTLAPSRGYIS